MTNTMTPSEIAEWLDIEANTLGHVPMLAGDAPYLRQAAATIRAQAEALKECRHNHECAIAAWSALDERSEAKLKIATEALEVANSEATRSAETAGCDGWRSDAMCRSIAKMTTQALARIKEVG